MLKVTTNHSEIRRWAEKYRGKPEILKNTETETYEHGIRIDFPGRVDDAFFSHGNQHVDVSWAKFFEIFDKQDLAFEYEEIDAKADPSIAYRFVKRSAV